ncbi:uncharacterized protein LAESUDRAFT_718141 [Laetiporus sulphureus 93-53]|uniref:RRM domain-containing protein n=1 Tax=Laetiporus sulphureus 93-53 TaxID=1314785 RepID=A0A165B8D6_9APHY|nr:uncharacterized protein LAESUDRAFT_718141 [Laetiporus sulphureus 93-53]KZT00480.1 hypothetical protein LAESUDRAFT_718141 [Laetiporus sulphureus 93-53]
MPTDRIHRIVFVETDHVEADIRAAFAQCGNITQIYPWIRRAEQPSHAYFIEFADDSSVKRARALQLPHTTVHVVAFSHTLCTHFTSLAPSPPTAPAQMRKHDATPPLGPRNTVPLPRRQLSRPHTPTALASSPAPPFSEPRSALGKRKLDQSTATQPEFVLGPLLQATSSKLGVSQKSEALEELILAARDVGEDSGESSAASESTSVPTSVRRPRRRAGKRVTQRRNRERDAAAKASALSTSSLSSPGSVPGMKSEEQDAAVNLLREPSAGVAAAPAIELAPEGPYQTDSKPRIGGTILRINQTNGKEHGSKTSKLSASVIATDDDDGDSGESRAPSPESTCMPTSMSPLRRRPPRGGKRRTQQLRRQAAERKAAAVTNPANVSVSSHSSTSVPGLVPDLKIKGSDAAVSLLQRLSERAAAPATSTANSAPVITLTFHGSPLSVALDALDADAAGIIDVLRVTAGSMLERDKWMVVAGWYRGRGLVLSAVQVVSEMINVMTSSPVSLPVAALRPAYLMLASCYRDLVVRTQGREAEEHARRAAECLKLVYGEVLPPVAAQVLSKWASAPERRSMEVSGMQAKDRREALATQEVCPLMDTSNVRRPTGNRREQTASKNERENVLPRSQTHTIDSRVPTLEREVRILRDRADESLAAKRRLEDELGTERTVRRRVERELEQAKRGEAFALAQARAEVEARRGAERRESEARRGEERARREAEDTKEEARRAEEGARRARVVWERMGEMCLRAAREGGLAAGGEQGKALPEAAGA